MAWGLGADNRLFGFNIGAPSPTGLDYSNVGQTAASLGLNSTPTKNPGEIIPTYKPFVGPTYNGPQSTPQPTNTSTGGDILGSAISNVPSGPSPDQQAMDQLNSGYNDYFAQLDAQMGALGGQQTGQQQIAQNTYDQGLNTATSQFTQGQSQLEGNRSRTLNDLSENLMQSFRQGNTMLGTRGASDSSAANQYSYALAKEGNRSRGDLQSQYDQNLFKLKNTYDTETKNLELQKNTQLQQIAQWFSEAQNTLRAQKGQAGLQKSQQALSLAMQAAEGVRQEAASKISALDQWATNHATSFKQLAGQLAQNSQFSTQAPSNFGFQGGQAQGGGLYGYGTSTEDKKNGLFG